jgi:hypothetical protein
MNKRETLLLKYKKLVNEDVNPRDRQTFIQYQKELEKIGRILIGNKIHKQKVI